MYLVDFEFLSAGMDVAFGVVGVASLAIELTEKLCQLRDFVESAKAAPDTTASLLIRIRDLSHVLQEVHDDADGASNQGLIRALATCQENIQQIEHLTQSWIKGFDARNGVIRAWHKTKAAKQASKVKELEDLLDSTKLTLLIAQNNRAR